MFQTLNLHRQSFVPPPFFSSTAPWINAAMPCAPSMSFAGSSFAQPSFAQPSFPPQSFAPQSFAPQSFAPQSFAPQSFAPQSFAPQSSAHAASTSNNHGAYAALPIFELNPQRPLSVFSAPIGRPVFQGTGTPDIKVSKLLKHLNIPLTMYIQRNAQVRNDPIASAMSSRWAREAQSHFEADK